MSAITDALVEQHRERVRALAPSSIMETLWSTSSASSVINSILTDLRANTDAALGLDIDGGSLGPLAAAHAMRNAAVPGFDVHTTAMQTLSQSLKGFRIQPHFDAYSPTLDAVRATLAQFGPQPSVTATVKGLLAGFDTDALLGARAVVAQVAEAIADSPNVEAVSELATVIEIATEGTVDADADGAAAQPSARDTDSKPVSPAALAVLAFLLMLTGHGWVAQFALEHPAAAAVIWPNLGVLTGPDIAAAWAVFHFVKKHQSSDD